MKTGANRNSVDETHQVIREEYAALILVEVNGKEAELLDSYVRNMYIRHYMIALQVILFHHISSQRKSTVLLNSSTAQTTTWGYFWIR